MIAISLAPRLRPLCPVLIAPGLVLFLAIAWSGFWFYSASQVDVMADAWRAREAKSGRVYDCARRSVAGFRFRLETRWEGASVKLVGRPAGQPPLPPITAKLDEI